MQVAHTPKLQPPMVDLLGWTIGTLWHSNRDWSEDLYAQKSVTPTYTNWYPIWKDQNIPEISMMMYTEYKHSWEKAMETTTLSPSALHFGHYIAGVAMT